MRGTEVTFTHAALTRLQANTHFTSGLIFHYQSEEYACAAEKRNTRRYTLSQYAAHLRKVLLRLGGLCILPEHFLQRSALFEVQKTPADFQTAKQRCAETDNLFKMDNPKPLSFILETDTH